MNMTPRNETLSPLFDRGLLALLVLPALLASLPLARAQTTTPVVQTTNMTQGSVADSSDPSTWPATFDGKTSLGPHAWVDGPSLVQKDPGLASGVSGGQAGAVLSYVCRAAFADGTHPGEYSNGQCDVAWGGAEKLFTSRYELLVNTRPDLAKFLTPKWVDASVSAGTFQAGSVGTTPLRPCRAIPGAGGSMHLGKEWDGQCHIGFEGREVAVPKPYQVLSLGFDKAAWLAAQPAPVTSGGTISGTTSLDQNLALNQSTTTLQNANIDTTDYTARMLDEFNNAHQAATKTSWQPGTLGTGFTKLANTLPRLMGDIVDEYNAALADPAPAAISWGENRTDVFAKGASGTLQHGWWDGSSWHLWEDRGQNMLGGPAVASLGPGHLDVFVRGTNSAVWHSYFGSGTWHEWQQLGPAGAVSSDPAAISWGPNRIDLFARGASDGLWHMWWDGSAWRGPENLGGKLVGSPTAASWEAGRTDVFVRSVNNALWHKWEVPGRWNEWEQLSDANALTASPAAVCWGPGRLDVFARGNPDGLWHRSFADDAWRAPENRGGSLTSGLAVASWDVNRLDLFSQTRTHALSHSWFDGSWHDWEQLGAAGALASNASFRKDRAATLAGMTDGDKDAQALMILLMVGRAKSILDRDPATWSLDEQGFVSYLKALAVDQRIKAAGLAMSAFEDWKIKDRADHEVGLNAAFYTPGKPPAEFLEMAKGGYAVTPYFVQNFGKIVATSAGLAGTVAIGTTAGLAGSGVVLAAMPVLTEGATIVGITGGAGYGATAGVMAGFGGAVAVAALLVTSGIIKGVELADYDKYVQDMDAAVAEAKNPVDAAYLKNLLSTGEGASRMTYWLAAQAATGTK